MTGAKVEAFAKLSSLANPSVAKRGACPEFTASNNARWRDVERALTDLQQCERPNHWQGARDRVALAAWHYITIRCCRSGAADLSHRWRQRYAEGGEREAGGGARGGAEQEAFAVLLDFRFSERVQIGLTGTRYAMQDWFGRARSWAAPFFGANSSVGITSA